MKLKIFLTAFIFGSAIAFGQNAQEAVELIENEQGFGIRAAGMGNAYTAVADDYSAIYWNPAGLAQLDYGQIYGSLYHNDYENSTGYFNSSISDNRTFTKLQSLGIAYPFPVRRGSFVIGFGYQKINNLDGFAEFGGFSTKDNFFQVGDEIVFNKNIQQDYSIYNDGGIDQWSFAAAIDLSPNFSAGLSLNFIDGDKTYTLDYLQSDDNNNYQTFPDDFSSYDYYQRILTNYSGFNAELGGLFKLSKNMRFGASITFPQTMTIEEEWSESYTLTFDDGFTSDSTVSGSYDYELELPFKFSAGLSYENEMLTISSAIDYRDWSQLKFSVPSNRNPDDYDELLSENTIIRDKYRGVLSYSFGGEFRVPRTGLMLRGGFKNVPSAEKNLSSDFDRKFYSIGVGYAVDKRTTLDFAYTLGEWKRNFDYAYSSDTVSEEIKSQIFLFGLKYHF
ncbi:MAG: outer membrane protein transport protein [Calditrichae bacterium]|nr:outer membrane protein transport protein [Calditrichota bacterium]MCB9057761.1 outer membrane protein transport protein [Calditrichia bacterium]